MEQSFGKKLFISTLLEITTPNYRMNKMNKEKIEDMFNYASSIRDDGLEWLDGNVSNREFIQSIYMANTRDYIRSLVEKYETKEAKIKLAKMLYKNGDPWAFDMNLENESIRKILKI